jgi:NAD(P)-dependent dehydrogenase (short-subunit alcohol dehydrogenase family)
MNDDLSGARMVITGGARGIGAVTARMAVSRGALVMIADINDEAAAATTAGLEASGGTAFWTHCDVSQADQAEALMQEAAARLGGIDILHNNAGLTESMLSADLSIETMAQETWDRVLSVNIGGTWLCTRAALPFLKQSRRASVINAGSTASVTAYPYRLAYGTSKAAVAGLTRNLAVALAPYNIRVNCYCPSLTRTDLIAAAAATVPAGTSGVAASHLVYRIAEPEEIAEVICFLASPRSSFVTGAVWLVDGGSLAWRGNVDQLPQRVLDDLGSMS